MGESTKVGGTNPFSLAQGKAFTRLKPDVPFWWRKVTRRMVTMRVQQFRTDGKLPFTRTDLESFFAKNLPTFPPGTPFKQSSQGKRIHSFTSLEDKLDVLLSLVRPESNQGRTRQSPLPVQFGGRRFAFWEKDPPLRHGDHIEIHLGLFPDDYVLVHGYAQVIQTTRDGQSGLTRVFCQMVDASHGAALPAQNQPHGNPGKPQQSVSQPLPAKVEPVRAPAAAGNNGPSPSPQGEPSGTPPPLEPTFRVDGGADEDNDANRRQAFRVNDDVAFSWKIVGQDDVMEAQGYFKQHDRLPVRSVETRLRNLLDQYADNLKRLDKRFARTETQLSWFRTELLVLFQRALRKLDEDAITGSVVQLHEISVELSSDPAAITPQLGQVLTLIRQRVEQQQKNSIMDPVLAINRINEGNEIIKKIDNEIANLIQETATLTPSLTQKLRLFHEEMSKVQISQINAKKKWLASSDHMIKSQVNLSATGVAFRTSQDIIKKGDYIQLNMELSANGTDFRAHSAYGQVVLVKQLSAGKPYRIATQFILIPRKMEDDLGAHIARKQREVVRTGMGG
ncbi:MAG: hypothetical protein HQL63_09710 [Magnetococcales bacterium]|nr:hypothetical protein [Magnetococcales bacterium]MBF0322498.1 hypothetical protein [Magnetococcales bacterium]